MPQEADCRPIKVVELGEEVEEGEDDVVGCGVGCGVVIGIVFDGLAQGTQVADSTRLPLTHLVEELGQKPPLHFGVH